MAKTNKFNYKEPDDYFPKSVRKKAKIGEYEEGKEKKKTVKKGKTTKK